MRRRPTTVRARIRSAPGRAAGSWRPGRTTRPARRRCGTRRPCRSCAPGPRTGCGARAAATRPAGAGSWKVSVWLTTPVDTVTCACAWPTPAWGRMAVAMRNPSVAKASSAWSTAGSSGAPTKRVQTSRSAGPTASGSLMSTSPAMRTCQSPLAVARRRDVAGSRRVPGAGSAWRMKSGSSALSSTSERVHSRSPWLIVTVLLANARPPCMRSTAISTGASGRPPRAKTVCTVFTRLSSWPARPATIDCASSWPPKITPWPASALPAR